MNVSTTMKVGDVVWYRLRRMTEWKRATVAGFPAPGLVQLRKGTYSAWVVLSVEDIEWKKAT